MEKINLQQSKSEDWANMQLSVLAQSTVLLDWCEDI